MPRRYEIVYIFDSALEEADINGHLDRFHALLKSDTDPEPTKSTNHWGKRTLAYSIDNHQIGYYVVVKLEAEPSSLVEFERVIKLEESLIRYQLIVNEGPEPVMVPVGPPRPDRGDSENGDKPGKEAAVAGNDAPATSDHAPVADNDATGDKT